MSHKNPKVAGIVAAFEGSDLDAHYLAFFECFNQQLFFEAHDVLEGLWLPQRHGPNGSFYKGLIQLAGAFVHVQKQRAGPATALLKLARANLQAYPAVHEHLSLVELRSLLEQWLEKIESAGAQVTKLEPSTAPKLALMARG